MRYMFENAGNTTLVQFAQNGAWENALALRPSDGAGRFLVWAGESGGELAVEIFSSSIERDDDCFVGVRFEDTSPERLAALADLVARFSQGDLPFPCAIETLGEIAGGALFVGEPDFLELGMFNYWKPFGPRRFWSRGDEGNKTDALDAVLSANPRYTEPTQRPIALEIAYAEPAPHWAGFLVSCLGEDRRWRLDIENAKKCIDES